jgi:hypothetical protein
VKRGRRRGQEKEVSKWRLVLALEHSKHGLNRKEILERKTQQWISRRTETEVFDTMIKSIEPYSSTKGTLREEVCSRLIKPTTQVYLGNVGLLTRPLTCGTIVQTRVQREGRPNIVQGLEALIPC